VEVKGLPLRKGTHPSVLNMYLRLKSRAPVTSVSWTMSNYSKPVTHVLSPFAGVVSRRLFPRFVRIAEESFVTIFNYTMKIDRSIV
jgi:hypothetical protein